MEQTNRYAKKLKTITDLDREVKIGSKEYYKHYYPKLRGPKGLEDRLGTLGSHDDITRKKDYTKRPKFRTNIGDYAKMQYERSQKPGLAKSSKRK